MKRKCKHPVRQLEVQLDEYLRTQAISCGKCGAVGVYPLFGVSDDLDLHVKHEIAAAEIVARLQTGPHQMTNAEFDGYNSDESSPFADLAAWHIGWLAAEATHDHSDGWAWDASRPIAEQLAGTAADDAFIDQIMDDAAKLADLTGDADRLAVAVPSVTDCRDEDILPDGVAS